MIQYNKTISKRERLNTDIFYVGTALVFIFLTYNKIRFDLFEPSDLFFIPLGFLIAVCGTWERIVWERGREHSKDIIDNVNGVMSEFDYKIKWLNIENSQGTYKDIKKFFNNAIEQYGRDKMTTLRVDHKDTMKVIANTLKTKCITYINLNEFGTIEPLDYLQDILYHLKYDLGCEIYSISLSGEYLKLLSKAKL